MIKELAEFISSKVNFGAIKNKTLNVNLNNRQIGSISSFSSNTIFYFPVILSDQCRLDEVTTIARALEKQYASFIVACISLIPFHRISSDNAWAVDEYLKQFHQNIGITPGADSFSHIYSKAVSSGLIKENSVIVPPPYAESIDDFFYRVWNESVEKDQDYVTYLSENYISLNDVFNESSIDPYTEAVTERYKSINEELDNWGFHGEPVDNFSDYYEESDDYFSEDDEDIDEEDVDDNTLLFDDEEDEDMIDESSTSMNTIRYTLESITDSKIKNCKSRKTLRSMETKLTGLKNKYKRYLSRYKQKWEENKNNNTDKKLIIRFNGKHISNPKAFMKEYGEYIKIINRKLSLIEKQRNVIGGNPNNTMSTNESISSLTSSEIALMNEASLKAKIRNELSDDDFGLPKERKFPIHDSKHVKLAIKMSGKCAPEQRKMLANRIANKAESLGMNITVSKKNPLYSYLPAAMKENAEINPVESLTKLDEDALDFLIESINIDLNSSDNEIFILLDEAKSSGNKPNGNQEKVNWSKMTEYEKGVYRRAFKKAADATKRASDSDKKAEGFRKRADTAWNAKKVAEKNNEKLTKDNEKLKQNVEELKQRNDTLTKRDGNIRDLTQKVEELEKEKQRYEDAERERVENERKTAEEKSRKEQEERNRTVETKHGFKIKIGNRNPGRGEIRSSDYNNAPIDIKPFDKEIFTKLDMQKCNEMVPTFTKTTIGFVVEGSNRVENRDILLGIKTYIHRVPTASMCNELYQGLSSQRKFLKFVKFITGEENSLADVLFGIKELKLDAQKANASDAKWMTAFKHRKRLSKMSIPFIMKNYLPNGTIVITMNEVNYIKSEFGIDVMRSDHASMLLDSNFLLGFVVLDQTAEIAYVMFHGVNQGQFQQYSYAALEREQKNTEREMRDLFRLLNK